MTTLSRLKKLDIMSDSNFLPNTFQDLARIKQNCMDFFHTLMEVESSQVARVYSYVYG